LANIRFLRPAAHFIVQEMCCFGYRSDCLEMKHRFDASFADLFFWTIRHRFLRPPGGYFARQLPERMYLIKGTIQILNQNGNENAIETLQSQN
jgi:hypothetical protein